MILLELFPGRTFSICAEVGDNDSCEVFDFLVSQIPPAPAAGEKAKKLPNAAAARGLIEVMRLYARDGRAAINDSDILHEADKSSGLWEFSKGNLRVYFRRISDDRIVLLSSAIVKKKQKTSSSDKQKGENIVRRYNEAKESGTLIVKTNDEQ